MKNRFTAASLLLLSCASIFAKDNCRLDFPYKVVVNKGVVTINDQKQELLRIDHKNKLSLYGESQNLNNQQQKLVTQLGNGFRSTMPKIADIAGEAAEIAVKAVMATINTLFSDNPDASNRLIRKLDGLSKRISAEVQRKHLNGHYSDIEGVSEEFERELDSIVSEVVENASGKAFLSIVSQALSNDEEEQKDLEFKMEMFGKDLEAQMEYEAERLATAAEQLCAQFKELDRIEAELQAEFPAYAKLDLIRPSH